MLTAPIRTPSLPSDLYTTVVGARMLTLTGALPSSPVHSLSPEQISEYLDPILQRKMAFEKPPTQHSAFLDSFLQSNYIAPTAK